MGKEEHLFFKDLIKPNDVVSVTKLWENLEKTNIYRYHDFSSHENTLKKQDNKKKIGIKIMKGFKADKYLKQGCCFVTNIV